MKIHQYICSVAIGLVLGACTSQEEQYDASGIFETTEVIVSAKGTGELQSFQVEEVMKLVKKSLLLLCRRMKKILL